MKLQREWRWPQGDEFRYILPSFGDLKWYSHTTFQTYVDTGVIGKYKSIYKLLTHDRFLSWLSSYMFPISES